MQLLPPPKGPPLKRTRRTVWQLRRRDQHEGLRKTWATNRQSPPKGLARPSPPYYYPVAVAPEGASLSPLKKARREVWQLRRRDQDEGPRKTWATNQ